MTNRVKNSSSKLDKTALILGAGYTARPFMRALHHAGYQIIATYRSQPARLLGLPEGALTNIGFNGALNPTLRHAFENADVILSSIAPFNTRANGTDTKLAAPHADAVLKALSTLRPKHKAWIGYLSASSVYGDLHGAWAYEDSPVKTKLQRGRNRAEAELAWLETGWPVHIFRLAGIYGPPYSGGRNPFARINSGKARRIIKAGHVFNRIHVDDIAGALMQSIKNPNPQRIYNLADGNPAPPQDVLSYAAKLMGVSAPPIITIDDPELSAMACSFYSESKRIAIDRAKSELGWTPKYPDYEIGLKAIFDTR